ncbi:RNA polymerase [Paraphysoderma sedebokerense]|nr:RNA polymerase [Paraphysoderma sedebokerense]
MVKEAIVFQDIFIIEDIDCDGKKFDRVSRILAHSEQYETDITLDVNNELYPLEINDRFALALASTLSATGDTSADSDAWRDNRKNKEATLADEYEYVMFGKCYKYEEVGSKVSIYISFGGLLMCLEGDYRHLQNFQKGENLYLLMRK